MHKRPEIADQRPSVVLRASVAGHRLGKGVNGLDVAVQGRWMERDGDGGFFKCGQFCLDA